MSNLEQRPAELIADCTADAPPESGEPATRALEILLPREVPLGGPRAMTVHRTLPQRQRSTIGAWCFLDHYGPDDVSATGGMRVPPHPHTGLQTVSWLFAGEIQHNDSVGTSALVRPGELNLMTAGRGISHSEVSTPETTILHGAQLWVALSDADRNMLPFFEHTVPVPFAFADATVRVFIGELAGVGAPASVFSPLLGAQLELDASTTVDLPLDESFEHGILVDLGVVTVDDEPLERRELGYLGPGRDSVRIHATADVRLLLLGGIPLGERLVMWWNFIGRGHDEVVGFRDAWQHDVIGEADAHGRFGHVAGYDGRPLPAPELPTVRLKPRD
ncbi:MAG TPA: pirin family protein [Microbacteriaceae bacterium]